MGRRWWVLLGLALTGCPFAVTDRYSLVEETPPDAGRSCDDGIQNGAETDVDCGAEDCPPCADGKACTLADHCESGACVEERCRPVSCTDRVLNGAETDVDCGGLVCPGCTWGEVCRVNDDCASNACRSQACLGG